MAHFVKKLWILSNPLNCPVISNKGVPPNGCFTIAIVQGTGLCVNHKNQFRHLPEGVYFCGQITETLFVDILPGTKATMIQLFPWTPIHFGFLNAYTFADIICPFSESGVLPILDLTKMIGLSNEKICRYVKKAFSPLFRNNRETALIIESTQMIIAAMGDIKVSLIVEYLHYSARHLQKAFKNHIGISPKTFIRIIKLRKH